MYLQSKNRYLKTAVLLGILVSLGTISSANAAGKHKHKHHHHYHETWVVHDVYVVDTRPPLISPVTVAAPARCETPANSPVAAPNGNYHTQHKFIVNDDGITTVQQGNPKTPSQQVQLNYYDE